MKTNITINDIDKVRAQALRWVKRSEKCRFEGMPFYLLHIGRCMKRLGFDYAVKEMTDATQRNCLPRSVRNSFHRESSMHASSWQTICTNMVETKMHEL